MPDDAGDIGGADQRAGIQGASAFIGKIGCCGLSLQHAGMAERQISAANAALLPIQRFRLTVPDQINPDSDCPLCPLVTIDYKRNRGARK